MTKSSLSAPNEMIGYGTSIVPWANDHSDQKYLWNLPAMGENMDLTTLVSFKLSDEAMPKTWIELRDEQTASQVELPLNTMEVMSAISEPRRSSCSSAPVEHSQTRINVPFSEAVATKWPVGSSASCRTGLRCTPMHLSSRT